MLLGILNMVYRRYEVLVNKILNYMHLQFQCVISMTTVKKMANLSPWISGKHTHCPTIVMSYNRPDCKGNFGVFAVKFSGDGRNLLAS